jgi:hypothetical protein
MTMTYEPHKAAVAAAGPSGRAAKTDQDPVIDTSLPEIQALQSVINDKPNTAQRFVDRMSGRDRALFAYYLRELGLMIENADGDAEVERRRFAR